ncbi:MAG TPA: hypothetical protein VG013_37930 [Gemmataceae bacterium]|nr:hypothetical protein [Gemmataceae bacterium]
MADFESMKRDLLAECEHDFVGLWSVIGYVADEMPDADEAKIRDTTLALLHNLMKAGLIQAGFPDSNGRTFHWWPCPADVVTDRITSLWKPNAPRPKPGEVVWFTVPSDSSVPAGAT